MFTDRYTEQELADRHFRKTIPPKPQLYYILLTTGRSFGYGRAPKGDGRWVARLRVTTGCLYRERMIGLADDTRQANGKTVLTYEQAKQTTWDRIDLAVRSQDVTPDLPTPGSDGPRYMRVTR